MAQRNRLTNNSDETDVSSLISGDTVFVIPYFQRPYRWRLDKLRQLNNDILNIIDDGGIHFLGAIIVHGRPSNPSDPDPYDVIDGQQRLTTLVLYICAVVKLLCKYGDPKEAAGLFLKYLAVRRSPSLPSNLKLHPCREDRTQLNQIFQDILSNSTLAMELDGFRPKYFPATGHNRGRLRNNYLAALRFLEEQKQHEGISRIHEIYRAILQQMSVVQIDVWDPTNGPKIFDSLNSRQEPMTVGDLVRNEIFSGVAGADIETIEEIDTNEWQPFYKLFRDNSKSWFDAYFFPYGLIKDPNVKKSQVYTSLRDLWRDQGITPIEIIAELKVYQDAFLDLVTGTNKCRLDVPIHATFKRFYEMQVPSSSYPFLMQLANAIRDNRISAQDGVHIMSVVESFLVRRAVCGHEPTGLHAVFKRLWVDCNPSIDATKVEGVIRKHKTVVWPTTAEFASAIRKRQLDTARITPYILLSLDRALGGDNPDQMPWIEHVLPQKPAPEWDEYFTRSEQHTECRVLANLIPLSSKMNRKLSNKSYHVKKVVYEDDSMFKTARDFAKRFNVWNPQSVRERGDSLVELAIARWPH